mgnify:FL=1
MGDDWRSSANCAGVSVELFFPGRGESTEAAKDVCRGCEAREACAEYALGEGIQHGIFGGLSELERQRIRRQRVLEARKAAGA